MQSSILNNSKLLNIQVYQKGCTEKINKKCDQNIYFPSIYTKKFGKTTYSEKKVVDCLYIISNRCFVWNPNSLKVNSPTDACVRRN